SGQAVSGKDFGLLPPECNPSLVDLYEALNDDLFSTTGVTLTVNMSQTHNFHTLDDEDWVQVDLQAGSTYTFTVDAAGARADTLLALFAPDGVTQLAQNDDADLPNFSSQIVWVATTTGTHYLRVTQLNPPILGGCDTDYTLTLTALLRTFLYLPIIRR
ncbi:MAG TPA: pre-peptidase C-terminal domain-containing protein, partial [Anaerolineales bacterium]|nr:pre-peptidase C-terminal domain-containing protein [Anaerolineales bacterium]